MARVRAAESGDRKQRIIEAAIKCFIKNGVAQTRLNEVAHEAKIDQPLIHYYFPQIDELYSAVVHVVLADLRERSTSALAATKGNPVKTVTEYVKGTLVWPREKPGYFSIWIYFYYLASYHPTFFALNRNIREVGRSRIEVMIYQGIEQKVFKIPSSMTVADVAINIQGILTGNAILAATEGPDFPIKKIEEQTLASVFHLLGR